MTLIIDDNAKTIYISCLNCISRRFNFAKPQIHQEGSLELDLILSVLNMEIFQQLSLSAGLVLILSSGIYEVDFVLANYLAKNLFQNCTTILFA